MHKATHVGIGPHTRLAHALDQISTSEEHDANLSPAAVGDEDAALRAPIDDLVKVVQDHGRALVLVLERLPGIYHEPSRSLLDGQSVVQSVRTGKIAWAGETVNSLAHAHAVRRLCKPFLPVVVGHRAVVATQQLVLSRFNDLVLGHFEDSPALRKVV